MNKSILKINNFLKVISSFIIFLPTSMSINYLWNFGSILGLFLMNQIITGLFLSMHYCPNTNNAFESVIHIMKDVNNGFIYRIMHMNGASMYFIFMYLHISRNIYYLCYSNNIVWNIGILILFISMASAFLGYVLPWGQMSFWGATVITNLLSAIPYIGIMIVEWIWGGFSINNSTLNRFFSFHFIFPFIILMMVILHLIFLHNKGSNNPMGSNNQIYKIPFHPYFIIKDLLGFFYIFMLFMFLNFQYSFLFTDPDNWIPANSMITPKHIKPEWYFLFAYSILRSIPNKLGGVIALLMSILILFIMPMFLKFFKLKSNKFYFLNQLMFWLFCNIFIILTWLGSQEIEYPYINLNMIFTNLYMCFFFLNPLIYIFWDKLN